MDKMAVFDWYDPDTCDTVKLAAEAYGVKLEAVESSHEPGTVHACVFGPAESIDRLLEDIDDGCAEPFSEVSEMPENEYQLWLAAELKRVGCTYTPVQFEEEDEDDED